MMKVWYIHGAHATSRSFAWLKLELPYHEYVDIEYSTDNKMLDVVDSIDSRINDDGEEALIIGHSLGGVLGVAVAQRNPLVKRLVTLASPFGGSMVAAMMRFMAPNTILDDIYPQSRLMVGIHRAALTIPTLSVITTGGRSPLIAEPNDGVVSVSSQKALYGPRYVERDVNHFEVLMDLETKRLIEEFIA